MDKEVAVEETEVVETTEVVVENQEEQAAEEVAEEVVEEVAEETYILDYESHGAFALWDFLVLYATWNSTYRTKFTI